MAEPLRNCRFGDRLSVAASFLLLPIGLGLLSTFAGSRRKHKRFNADLGDQPTLFQVGKSGQLTTNTPIVIVVPPPEKDLRREQIEEDIEDRARQHSP